MGCAASAPDVADATAVTGSTGQEKSRSKGASGKGISLKSMESIRSAIESLSINELELAHLVVSFSKEQLAMFVKDYPTQSEMDLLTLLREKLNGPLERLILSCFKLDVDLRTELIRESLQGKATDIEQLTDVVLTLNGVKAHEITKNYELLYGGSIITDIRNDYNGDKLWQRLVVRILSSKRVSRSSPVAHGAPSNSDADADAYTAGTEAGTNTLGKMFTSDAERLIMDIRERNFEHLLFLMATALPTEYVSICKKYFEMKGTVLRHDVADALEHRLEERYALLLAHDYLHSPASAYAFMAHTALVEGVSRDDARLARAAILSYDEHPDVPAVYRELYGTSLEDAIEKTGTGSYETTLTILWKIDKVKESALATDIYTKGSASKGRDAHGPRGEPVVASAIEDGAAETTAQAHARSKSRNTAQVGGIRPSKGSKKGDSKISEEEAATPSLLTDTMEERLQTPVASEPSTPHNN